MKINTYFDYQKAIIKADLSSNAKFCALVIASHFNWRDDNPAFPTNATLADETSLSSRSVIRAKQELEAKGYLTMQHRFNGSSLLSPAIPDSDTQSPPVTHSHSVEVSNDNGTTPEVTHSQGAVTHSHQGVTESHGGVTESHSNRELNNELNKEPIREEEQDAQASPGRPNDSLQTKDIEPTSLSSFEDIEFESPLSDSKEAARLDSLDPYSLAMYFHGRDRMRLTDETIFLVIEETAAEKYKSIKAANARFFSAYQSLDRNGGLPEDRRLPLAVKPTEDGDDW